MADLDLVIFTSKNFGEAACIRSILLDWTSYPDERLRPEFFGLDEPVRRKIAEEGVDAVTKLWTESAGGVSFRRAKDFRFETILQWSSDKGVDARPFPWRAWMRLGCQLGDSDAADRMLRFFVERLDAAFGLVTTKDELFAKHFFKVPFKQGRATGIAEKLVLDIDPKLPGVYWKTYFGPQAINAIGSERFAFGAAMEQVHDGRLVTPYPDLRDTGSDGARKSESEIISQIGKDWFFDRENLDLRWITGPKTDEMRQSRVREIESRWSTVVG